jgi:lipopolysaccharide biosynthesis regulator YciM
MWEPLSDWFLDPANQKLFFVTVAGIVVGLLIGRLIGYKKGDKSEINKRKADKAFFRGVQYVLSNEPDHAIEEFSKSVQVNSDTIETYIALGNLYRSKGDFERAILVRQSVILRPNIDKQIKLRALFDLGVDYRKGGLLNRALKTFLKLEENDPSNIENLKEIESIYEEMGDWENAFQTRQKIARRQKGNFAHILSHQLVEMGKNAMLEGSTNKAKSSFTKAISTNEKCVDAYLHLGDLHFEKGEFKKALAIWKKVVEVAPEFTFLACNRLESTYLKMRDLKPVEEFLKECANLTSDPYIHLAFARFLYSADDIVGAVRHLDSALELAPAFWEAIKFKGEILLAHQKDKEALTAYDGLIQQLSLPYLKFQCSHCGFEPHDLVWQCPQCKNWDTITPCNSTSNGTAKPLLPAQPETASSVIPTEG